MEKQFGRKLNGCTSELHFEPQKKSSTENLPLPRRRKKGIRPVIKTRLRDDISHKQKKMVTLSLRGGRRRNRKSPWKKRFFEQVLDFFSDTFRGLCTLEKGRPWPRRKFFKEPFFSNFTRVKPTKKFKNYKLRTAPGPMLAKKGVSETNYFLCFPGHRIYILIFSLPLRSNHGEISGSTMRRKV